MRWAFIFLVAASIFIVLYLVVVSILGVPLWYALPIRQLSTVALPTLVVQVLPQTPEYGNLTTVTVTNSSNQMPIQGADILLNVQGMNTITLTTDSTGQATFQYSGLITIVQANMVGIDSSSPVVVPKNPPAWDSADTLAAAIAFVSSAFGSVLSFFLIRRFPNDKNKSKNKKAVRVRKRTIKA